MRNLVIAAVVVMTFGGIAIYAIGFNGSSQTSTIIQSQTTTSVPAESVSTVARTTSTATVTYSANGNSPPIPSGCPLAKTVLSNGYRLEIYLPSAARVGDTLCMLFIVHNVNATGSPAVTGTNLKVIDANGHAMDVGGCVVTGPVTTFPIGTQYSCDTGWNTALPSRSTGLTPQSGAYHLTVTISGISITSDTDITLSA